MFTPSRIHLVCAGLGALSLAASGAGVASAATTPSAAHAVPDSERCEAPLPATVLGDPHLAAGSAAGTRVWHDGAGWHLRVTHPGTSAVTFSGTVRSGQPISATGYRLEKGDRVLLSNGGHTLTYAFTNHGGVDGIDFTDRCAVYTSFALLRAGHTQSPVAVYLGARGAHPTGNPFTVQRHHA